MKTAVITIVRGRHAHLRMHLRGLALETTMPYLHVVVSMGDDAVKTVVAQEDSAARVLHIDVADNGPLPLARARNFGAAEALRLGATLLVFLDVDCVAVPPLLTRYHEAACAGAATSALLCGPVTYLPHALPTSTAPDSLPALRNPHPARPAPADETTLDGDNFDLFWSLSFAVTAPTWRALGGFCEDYVGYGGEDTDFAWTARARGVKLTWVGGADAYHQFHPISDPPVEHLDDILVNAEIFHRRWGRWPMQGWITEFEAMGLVEYRRDSKRWVRVRHQHRASHFATHHFTAAAKLD